MDKFLMTPQEALLKIKAMFAEAQEAPVAPVVASFAEYILASGAKVMIDNLAVGGKVTLVDDMGNESPAPAGEHMLADGTKLVVDENSTITEVVAPEAAPAPEAPEAPETEVEMLKKKVAQMEAELADMKKVKCSVNDVKEQETKFAKAISDLTDVVIELSKAPSAAPTQPKESVKHFESKNDKVSRFLSMYAKK